MWGAWQKGHEHPADALAIRQGLWLPRRASGHLKGDQNTITAAVAVSALRLAQTSRARVAADFHHRRSAEAVADGLARSLPGAAQALGRTPT